jgi:hypothetical protein
MDRRRFLLTSLVGTLAAPLPLAGVFLVALPTLGGGCRGAIPVEEAKKVTATFGKIGL